MLNADWSVVIVIFVLFLFAVHIRLFAKFILIYLIYSTWKLNDRTRRRCSSLNYMKRGLIYATKLQRATGQLDNWTLLHTRATKLREKIAGVTSVLWCSFLQVDGGSLGQVQSTSPDDM